MERIELLEAPVASDVFLEYYNKNIPAGFPRVSIGILKKFQDAHPALFRDKDSWSVTKHRKRLIDWLSSNQRIS